MKLYHFPHSPSSRRVRMLMAEKQVAIPLREVDIQAGEQLGEPYKAINPRGEIPVLELDDGQHIAEAVAIMHYLEALHPEPALFGTSPVERGLISMWERRAEHDGFKNMESMIRNGNPAFAGHALTGSDPIEQIPALAERGRKLLDRFYGEVNQILATRPHLAGEAFSAADITLFTTVDFAAGFGGFPVAEAYGNLRAWHERVAARPSAGA